MDEKKKVYVVTAGSYSAYHICGVTLDYEKAKEMQKRYWIGPYDEASIEEYVLDNYADRGFNPGDDLVPVYEIRINPKGKIWYSKVSYYAARGEHENEFSLLQHDYFVALVEADEERAKKIACDQRAEMLALKNGL